MKTVTICDYCGKPINAGQEYEKWTLKGNHGDGCITSVTYQVHTAYRV